MQITIEDKNGLNAVLKVHVEAADYNESVKKAVTKYQKTMNVPGFRKGQVPFGVAQKIIGTDVKREQVDKLLQESIQNYLKENNINLVLSPLSTYVAEEVDWKQPEMDFTYDIGFRPEIHPNIESLNGLKRNIVVLSDEDLDKDIDSMRKSAGKLDMADVITDDAALSTSVKFTELAEDGQPLAEGQSKQKFYQGSDMPEAVKALILGKKPNEKFTADLFAALSEEELETLFEADKMTIRDLNHNFEVEVQAAFKISPADMNQELFDKYLEPGSVTTEEEFRTEWKKRVENYYQREADNMFFTEVRKLLPQNTQVDLPQEFLKKYYLVSYDAKSEEGVENFGEQFAKFEDELKWILISDVIAENNGIKITEENIISYTISSIRYQFMQQGQPEPEGKLLQQYAYNYLSEDSNYSRTVMVLKDNAVFDYLLGAIKTINEEISTQALSEMKKIQEEIVVD